MKIFITGGTGYIGQELLKQLLQDGHELHAMGRNMAFRNCMNHPNLHWFEGDLMNPESIIHAMRGCQQVYHTAAYARVYAKDPSTYYQLNVTGTEHVLEAASRLKVEKVVFTSSAAVIGPTGDDIANENSSRKLNYLNEYEQTKALAETIAISYTNKGLPVVIVNPSRVYGPGRESRSNPLLSVIRMMMKSPVVLIPGNGNSKGSYSFIDDVVQGHMLAMKHGRGGERYIIGGENVSYNELFTVIGKLVGNNTRILHLPIAFITAFSRLELLRAQVGGHEPWIVPGWVQKYMYHSMYSSDKAITELNYRITPLAKGIEKTIAFIQKLK